MSACNMIEWNEQSFALGIVWNTQYIAFITVEYCILNVVRLSENLSAIDL